MNEPIRIGSFWSNLFKPPAEKSEVESIICSMPPFKKLNQKLIRSLLRLIHNRAYSANEYIFYQGDPGIGLYIIISGEVLITQTTDDGERFDIALLKSGDFFGEVALLDEETRSASALSLKESQLAVIFKPDLDEFIEAHPKEGIQILRGITQIIATRLRTLNQDYFNLYNSIRAK
ncbi:cyclic nucleotide-binding domain-containing protein [Melioribacteraceae bacterium 4301-Me]|uniref:cyclic nucleotide-binding domain-containing protein n=1 Tax=Pyranulibacter aquaticus TaxID=3163344 RepID=UPI0035980AF3